MNSYKEVILPIVEDANLRLFQIANILSVVGLGMLGCSVGLLEVGTIRTIGVISALLFMASPFILRFFLDRHKRTGVIRFSIQEILIKLNQKEAEQFDVEDIRHIEFDIIDYEGETKGEDLFRSADRMNIRSGADNQVFWKTDKGEFLYKFKLDKELQKRQATFLLKRLEEQIMNS